MTTHARYLAYVLRHDPHSAGLKLGPGGWVGTEELLRAFRKQGRRLTQADLKEIVAADEKQRFTLSHDGGHIRAAQGHTIDVDLQLPNTQPPELLYHGTARDALDLIFQHGLRPMRRQHLHLSTGYETAVQVGSRHGKAVVLTIAASEMFNQGYEFYCADNGVWLTGHVPFEYVSFAASPE